MTGQACSVAPALYVAKLFDAYADNFDSHLVDKLKYQTPQLLQRALAKVPSKHRFSRCIDLG